MPHASPHPVLSTEWHQRLLTPALIVDLEAARRNVARVIAALDGDVTRWRPHVKTAKIPQAQSLLGQAGVRHFKCATTREAEVLLRTLQGDGIDAVDLLVAYPHREPALSMLAQVARRYPTSSVSVLCEDADLVDQVPAELGLWIDVNPEMNRTGVPFDDVTRFDALVEACGDRLTGLHAYDGQVNTVPPSERRASAFQRYERVLELHRRITSRGVSCTEIVTSGTPAFLDAAAFPGFRNLNGAAHRVSPGTVLYSDLRAQEQVPEVGLEPAAFVLTTVVSHPSPGRVTCDAGSKSVAAEAGHPCAEAVGHPGLIARVPSEEHLPFDVEEGGAPPLGTRLWLVPRHVCPTVNLAEAAVMVDGSRVEVAEVAARAHDLVFEGG